MSWAKHCLAPLLKRAARAYAAGETLCDASDVAGQIHSQGFSITLGYWDGPNDTAEKVARIYGETVDYLAHQPGDYISIKLPALGASPAAIDALAARAQESNVRLHFDALAPDTVEQTQKTLERLSRDYPRLQMSTTLPTRWRRSLVDAEWALERNLPVRIVKGQWADPTDPSFDARVGFHSLVERLSGRAKHVAIATHDVPLGIESIKKLRAANTSCEWELLYGLPRRAAADWAKKNNVSVRVYVPFGESFLPYALKQSIRQPRKLWWLVRDLALARR